MQEHLADGDWHPSEPILELLADRGLSSGSVMKRGKELAGVEVRKVPGTALGGWEWRIPRLSEPKNPSKNPSPLKSLPTDSWAENSPNPQCSSEESKNPSSVTVDSSVTPLRPVMHEPSCGHSSRWWRMHEARVWVCELCHPAPAGAHIIWSDTQGGLA
jgi:hypothetical protein